MRLSVAVLVACSVVLPACGKKGPPRAPLNLVPQPPVVAARRLGDTVLLQVTVPMKNLNGPGAVSIDRLDVFAVNVAAGVPPPPNRDLLKPVYRIGRIEVRPADDPDAPPPEDAKPDTRPKPGDVVTFVDTLTPEKRTLQVTEVPQPKTKKKKGGTAAVPPPPIAAAAPAAPGAAAPPPALPQVATRVYVIEGVAASGRRGAPSTRVTMPLVTAPPPIQGTPSLSATEGSIVINWNPPPSATDEALGVTYNVYAVPPANGKGESTPAGPSEAPKALNDKPLDALTFEQPGADPGKEQCFTVRSIATVENMPIESEPSQPACITPKDVFPPAAPKNLAVIAGGEGRMNLIWDANTETDLAGYVVMRGENPDRLAAITPEPIRETRYTDATAKPGTTYVYAVIAVDKAGNRSQPSNKVTETAR